MGENKETLPSPQKINGKKYYHGQNLWSIYDDLQRLIAFADRKATTLLTAHSIAVGFALVLVSIGPINEAIFELKSGYWFLLWGLGAFLLACFVIICAFSFVNTLRVIMPRYGEITAPYTQFFFSRSIAKEFQNGESYYNNFLELNEQQINTGLSNQIYAIGDILNAKMNLLTKTVYLFIAFTTSLVLSCSIFLFYHEFAV